MDLTWIEVFALQEALQAVQLETARLWARAGERAVVVAGVLARCGCGAEVQGLLADCEACLARVENQGEPT